MKRQALIPCVPKVVKIQRRKVAVRSQVEGKMGRHCLIDKEFPFRRMKKLWYQMTVMAVQYCTFLCLSLEDLNSILKTLLTFQMIIALAKIFRDFTKDLKGTRTSAKLFLITYVGRFLWLPERFGEGERTGWKSKNNLAHSLAQNSK